MLATLERKTTARRKPIQTEIATITPDIAQAYLTKNVNNRNHSAMTVSTYARDMKAGRWMMTGDPIQFDTNGNLLNGQHRLMACVEADTPFDTVIVYGLPAELQAVIDTGKPRSLADKLKLDGFHNTQVAGAIARLVYAAKMDTDSGVSRPKHVKPSHSELLAVIEKHHGIHHSARATANVVAIPKAIAGFVHYIGYHILKEEERADAYIEVLKSGVPDYSGDPVHRLRERILRSSNEKAKLSRDEVLKGAVHAWNLFSQRTKSANLKWGDTVEFDGLKKKSL